MRIVRTPEAVPVRETVAPDGFGSPSAREARALPDQGPARPVAHAGPEPLWPAPPRKSPDAPPTAANTELSQYRAARALLLHAQPKAAADAFRSHLAAYPNGLLFEEAEISLLEALHASRSPTFVGEAERWLSAHAEHPRAKEIRALVARASENASKPSREGANER